MNQELHAILHLIFPHLCSCSLLLLLWCKVQEVQNLGLMFVSPNPPLHQRCLKCNVCMNSAKS